MASKKIKGIIIEIGGDSTGLDKAIKKANTSIKDLSKELKGVNSLLKFDPTNADLLRQKQDILNSTLAETRNKLKVLEDSQEQVNKKWQAYGEKKDEITAVENEIEETQKSLKKLQKEQEETTQEFKEGKASEEQYQKINSEVKQCQEHLSELQKQKRKLNEETISDEEYRDYQREVINTQQKVKDLEKQIKQFGSVHSQQLAAAGEKIDAYSQKIESAGQKVSKVSAVAGVAMAGVVKGATDWESAFTGVEKTVDGTSEQMTKLEQDLLDLSKTTASTATDIAGVAEAAGQLGIATDNVADFTKVMVQLGDSTNLTAEESASALAKLVNITGMSAEKYENLGSVIVDLGNNFATTESDIVEMTTRLASTGSVIGLTEAQMMAIGTALSSVGIEAEAGGSAISKLLKKMETAVATNEKSTQAIKATGYSLRELQLMASNSSSDFKDIAASLGLTTNELKTFMNNAASLEQFASVSGTTAAEFKKAYGEDAVGALSMFINGLSGIDAAGGSAVSTLQDMGLTEVRLSNAILALSSSNDILGQSLSVANNAWNENSALSTEAEKRYSTTESKLTQLKNTLTELAVKLGDLLLPAVNSAVEKIKTIIERFTNLNPVLQKIILLVLGITTAVGPVLIVIGKVVSSIGSILTIAPKIVSIVGKIIPIITKLKGVITGLFSANPIGAVIAGITAVIAILVSLYKNCEPFRDFVDNLWAKIKTFFNESIPNALATVREKISAVFSWLKENALGLVLLLVNPFAGVFKLLYDNCEGFKNKIDSLVEKIKEFFTVKIPNAIQVVIQWFSDLPYKIGYAIGQILGHIAGFAVDAYNFFTVKLPEYINTAINWFKSLPEKIKKAISSAITNIVNWAEKMKEKAVAGVQKLIANVTTFFKELPSKIKNAISSAITAIGTWCSDMKAKASAGIKKVVTSITDGFKNLPTKMKNIGKNIIEGIWNGIKNAKDWLLNKIKNFADGVIAGFKDGFDIHSPSHRAEKEIGEELPPGIAKGVENNADLPVEAMEDIADDMMNIPQFNGVTIKRQLHTTFSSTNAGSFGSFAISELKEVFKEALLGIEIPMYLNGERLVGGIAHDMDKALGIISGEEARGC